MAYCLRYEYAKMYRKRHENVPFTLNTPALQYTQLHQQRKKNAAETGLQAAKYNSFPPRITQRSREHSVKCSLILASPQETNLLLWQRKKGGGGVLGGNLIRIIVSAYS